MFIEQIRSENAECRVARTSRQINKMLQEPRKAPGAYSVNVENYAPGRVQTSFLDISHLPVAASRLQLAKQCQFLSSILGVSDLK